MQKGEAAIAEAVRRVREALARTRVVKIDDTVMTIAAARALRKHRKHRLVL